MMPITEGARKAFLQAQEEVAQQVRGQSAPGAPGYGAGLARRSISATLSVETLRGAPPGPRRSLSSSAWRWFMAQVRAFTRSSRLLASMRRTAIRSSSPTGRRCVLCEAATAV